MLQKTLILRLVKTINVYHYARTSVYTKDNFTFLSVSQNIANVKRQFGASYKKTDLENIRSGLVFYILLINVKTFKKLQIST